MKKIVKFLLFLSISGHAWSQQCQAAGTVITGSIALIGPTCTPINTFTPNFSSLAIGYTGTSPYPWPLTLGTTGQFHVDASGNVRGATFNGIGLATNGATNEYLSGAGTYLALPTASTGFPITIGSTSIAAGSTTTSLSGLVGLGVNGNASLINPTPATSEGNVNSGALYLTGSFYDLGATSASWFMQNMIDSGSTPSSTFYIGYSPGGTTGTHEFQVLADQLLLEAGNGDGGTLNLTGNSSVLSIPDGSIFNMVPTGISLIAASPNSNVEFHPGTGGYVLSTSLFQAPIVRFVNGGSNVVLNGPAGGSGTFNQNVTAENGDLQPCPTGTPTIALGSASGTPGNGATVSILGTNCAGMVTVKTGSDTVSQAYIFTVTFSNPFTHYGFCTFSPSSNTLSDPGITPDNVYMSTGYATGFSLGLVGTGVMEGLANHQWSYTCQGY